MPPDACTVTFVPRLAQNDRRMIAFLESIADARIDARRVYDRLIPRVQKTLKGRFDHWLAGIPYPKYYHGWNNDPNRSLFVFKWVEKQKFHRMYGFLCHPKPTSNPRLLLCLLASHAIKTTWETDPGELNFVRGLMQSPAVTLAIARIFPQYQGEGKGK